MRSSLAISILFAGSFFVKALAYVPPSAYVLKQGMGKRGGLKNVKIQSDLKLGSSESSSRLKVTTWINYAHAALLVKITDASGVEVGTFERRWNQADQVLPPVALLLFSKQLEATIQELKKLDFAVVSEADLMALATEEERLKSEQPNQKMGRLKSTAWIYSRPAQDQAKRTELWIEKDTYYPMRLIYPAGGLEEMVGGELIDVKLESYRTFQDFSYPRSSQIDGVFKEELADVTVNGDQKTFEREMHGIVKKEMSSALRAELEPYIRVMR